MTKSFAFVNHYLNTDLLDARFRIFKSVRHVLSRFQKDIIVFLPPYRYVDIGPVHSILGSHVTGVGIACPLLPEHFVVLDRSKVLKKLILACRIAERDGAKIVGLGGFTSVFGNEGEEVSKHLSIAVTSGNSFTAALVIEGICRAAEVLQIDLIKSKAAIIGATGDIGRICTSMLAKRCGEIRIAARNEARLSEFASKLKRETSAQVTIHKYSSDAIADADIVLTATSALTTIIEPSSLKSGAVVCDVAYPANIPRDIWKKRRDVLAFEGGLAEFPTYDQMKHSHLIERFSPYGTLHGCLAETIILALEGRFESYSLGRGHITEAKVKEIGDIGRRHGFRASLFCCGDKRYSEEDLGLIREIVRKTSKTTG